MRSNLQFLTLSSRLIAHFTRTGSSLIIGWAGVLFVFAAPQALASGDTGPTAIQGWSPATLRSALNALPKGDVQRGRVVHQEMFCASCHGESGTAPTHNWPHLAGQKATYTAKMMLDYQSGLRAGRKGADLMRDIARMMSPQQIADVSAFYAAQPLPRGTEAKRLPSGAQPFSAEQLVRVGDPTRLLTPCASCHGVQGQGGKLEAAALAGQNPLYFVRTLLDYQSGIRHNDAAKGMSAFARKLTRAEIESLAIYYAELPTKR